LVARALNIDWRFNYLYRFYWDGYTDLRPNQDPLHIEINKHYSVF
jgi:hypothetical protein